MIGEALKACATFPKDLIAVPDHFYSHVMDFKWGDSIWSPMLVQRPSDTHFSESRTSGGKSPLARDDDNRLVTQGVLFNAGTVLLGTLCAGVVIGFVAYPHIEKRLSDLRSKLSRRAEESTGAEAPVPLTAVTEAEPEQPGPPRLRAV